MANTVVQTTLNAGPGEVTRLIHVISDGSEETNLVIYDNSTLIADTSRGTLMEVESAGLSPAGVCRLNWDQTTPLKLCSWNPGAQVCFNWRKIGGLKNPAGTGKTGDLTLTTLGLAAGDEFFIIFTVKQ